MFDAFVAGLLINLQLWPFIYMLIGAAIGFCVGILPVMYDMSKFRSQADIQEFVKHLRKSHLAAGSYPVQK